VAGCTGGRGPRKPPLGARANRRWLLSYRLSLTRRLHPMSRLSEPLRTTPHTKQCRLPEEKGVRPLFQRVNTQHDTRATPAYVDFYRGERLAMGSTAIGSAPSRKSTYGAVATGLPIASTSVASRSPVRQFPRRVVFRRTPVAIGAPRTTAKLPRLPRLASPNARSARRPPASPSRTLR